MRRAAELGYDAIAIADRDGLYGMVRAHEEAEKDGVRLVVGCELTLGAAAPARERHGPHREPRGLHEPLPHPDREPPSSSEGEAAQAGGRGPAELLRRGARLVRVRARRRALVHGARRRDGRRRVAFFARRSARASASPCTATSTAAIARASVALVLRARELDAPIVATNAVRYARREEKLVYDVLHCIRENVTLDEAGRALARTPRRT